MEKQESFYTLKDRMPKPKTSSEIPDTHTHYRKILCGAAGQPLAFVLMCGYIEAAAQERVTHEPALSLLLSSLDPTDVGSKLPRLVPPNLAPRTLLWLKGVRDNPRNIETHLADLGRNPDLQKDLENILVHQCRLLPQERVDVQHLPLMANALQCKILVLCPYRFQRVFVEPEDRPVMDTVVVVSMDSEIAFRLYVPALPTAVPDTRNRYFTQKQELKEEIVKQLLKERQMDFGVLQQLALLHSLDPVVLEERIQALKRLDELINNLTRLKEVQGKPRATGKPSRLLEYLQKVKADNVALEKVFRGGREAFDKVRAALEVLSRQPRASAPVADIGTCMGICLDMSPAAAPPSGGQARTPESPSQCCMVCGTSQDHISRLGCGHMFCDHCLECIVNDMKSVGFAFSVKCRLRYCFYIATYSELEQILGRENCRSVFTPELLANANPNTCLLCGKHSDIQLHSNHALCKNCMMGYAEQRTQGEFIQIDPRTKNYLLLQCPGLNCPHQFPCTQYLGLLPKNEPHIFNALRRFGVYHQKDYAKAGLAPEIMAYLRRGRCFKCGIETNIARLHESCTLCFCKNDMSSLGTRIAQLKSTNCSRSYRQV